MTQASKPPADAKVGESLKTGTFLFETTGPFQKMGNPHIRIMAMLMLGLCFVRKNMNNLARSVFSEVNQELTFMDAPKKEKRSASDCCPDVF